MNQASSREARLNLAIPTYRSVGIYPIDDPRERVGHDSVVNPEYPSPPRRCEQRAERIALAAQGKECFLECAGGGRHGSVRVPSSQFAQRVLIGRFGLVPRVRPTEEPQSRFNDLNV